MFLDFFIFKSYSHNNVTICLFSWYCVKTHAIINIIKCLSLNRGYFYTSLNYNTSYRVIGYRVLRILHNRNHPYVSCVIFINDLNHVWWSQGRRMVGRLADTELPGRQRQGETNPDQIQCGLTIWIMLKMF